LNPKIVTDGAPMDYTAVRKKMVDNQIRTNRVTDPLVISAMEELPREAFVPEELRGIAYVDEAVSLGHGRFLMEPMVLARLLQEAEVTSGDLVLDIGCGTGYAAAVLARLASTVVALESDPGLAVKATETLAELGIDTVAVVEGPLNDGYPKQAPYDVIVFGGSVDEIPQGILEQLAEDGRLVAVVGANDMGRGTVITRRKGLLSRREVFDAGTPPLPGFTPASTFAF
jgi:protein-L-isoaspartate(D-aspartate) O-methyltransferase